MSNIQVYDFIKNWLEEKELKIYFDNRKKEKEKYIKIKEQDFYRFCYKLISLVEDYTE